MKTQCVRNAYRLPPMGKTKPAMTTIHYRGTLSDPARRASLVLHLTNDVAPSPEAGPDNLVDCITLAAEMTHRQENSL